MIGSCFVGYHYELKSVDVPEYIAEYVCSVGMTLRRRHRCGEGKTAVLPGVDVSAGKEYDSVDSDGGYPCARGRLPGKQRQINFVY